ncbi:DUF3164 family protein [Jiella endophytica]|uniref:DUF3164 family protein n=1 Tax=Jiella endophytica TaxID=2558362 RepID=A0A4Y8RFX1_9HYPH|nr:DUF3164 family protein [Jiella endophytica]TFF20517.1 DUF3164 family protein [Jiella endophytica]
MSATTQTLPANEAPSLPPGAVEVGGRLYLPDSKGNLVPLDLVKAEDRLEDEMVRKCLSFAEDLSAQIGRFRGHTMEDIGAFQAILDQEYGAKRGGAKGNATFMSFDGMMKVQVQQADLIEFGAQLQTAKKLIDEYLTALTADASAEIQVFVNRAFDVDKEGQVNRSELFRLRRLQIDDKRWQDAMRAISEAIRVVGSKEYVRFYKRDSHDGAWQAVTIDLAKA